MTPNSRSKMQDDSPDEVDLSSFPLLRVDQIHFHETQTLLESEAQLQELQSENGLESITPFLEKLLVSIRKEIADRRANEGKIKQLATPPKPTSTKKPHGRKPSWIGNRSNASRTTNTKTNKVVTFVSSPKSSSNFRSRVKAAKESLKSRSQISTLEQSEQERAQRIRQALDTMQVWRTERDKSKAQRDALFEEERLQRQRRKVRMEREKQVRDTMHAAAEEAKSMALALGCTEEEAIVEAAAAATQAANLVDGSHSLLFNSSLVDSDDDTYLDNESEGEEVLPKVLFDGVYFTCKDSPVIGEEKRYERPSAVTIDVSLDEIESTESKEPRHSPCKKDIPTTPTKKSSSHERAVQEPELHHIGQEATEVLTQLPTEKDQLTMTVMDEGDCLQLSLTCGDDQAVTESASTTTSLDNEAKNTSNNDIRSSPCQKDEQIPVNRDKCRHLCDLFPTFSSIFTKFAKKGRSHLDDSTQKELISCMQHQIKLHEQLRPCNCSQIDGDSSGDYPESYRFYRINSRRSEVRTLLDEVFSHFAFAEWNELPHHCGDSWNLLWTWGLPKASVFDNLLVFQKVNRFRQTKGLTRKDLLQKNMQRNASGHLMPLTYALPHEYNAFVCGYSTIQKTIGFSPNFWIVKPIGLSRGRGISVIKDISQVAYSQPIVIQRYISNPMLFMGFKFDLRIYVLVTSFNPLEAFIYKEGLARFGSRKYSNKPESLGDTRIHLTNTSIQKEFGDFMDRSHPAYLAGSHGTGSKVALTWLWKRFEEQGMDTSYLWMKVVDVCHKALTSVEAGIPNQPNSFELFGFDVIFDSDEKCWLIEVNSSPSLSCDSSLDNRIKGGLIADVISLVDPIAFDRMAVSEVCKRRITHRKACSLLEEDLSQILPNITSHSLSRNLTRKDMPVRLGKFECISVGAMKEQC